MDKVTVTEADRTTAADVLDEISALLDHVGIGQVADLIRDGEYDEHDIMPYIAAHRHAAMLEGVRLGLEAGAGPLDDVGIEIEDALVSEGIFTWGSDGERFERMFEVVMTQRRALDPAAIVEVVK